ncbi:MAG: hypothetical protein DMG13_26915 [Acidobacteria bacterium]|nr:MAG: hypothetical protein DMG13_26915 [Acidobacteriota bacterium]
MARRGHRRSPAGTCARKEVAYGELINVGTGTYTASPLFRTGFRWDTFLFPIQDLITAFNAGMIQNYYDIIQLPN